jgi:hypothetical protein
LERGDYFGVLSVPTALKIAVGDDFYQVEQRGAFETRDFFQFSIEFPASRHQLLAQAFLLIISSAVQIDAIMRATDAGQAMLAATGTADRPAKGGARSLSLSP